MNQHTPAVPASLSRRSTSNTTVSSCGISGRSRELLAYKKTKPCQTDQTVINIMHLNEGEYERLEKNCRISYIKTLLASVVSRKPTNKRGNLFKIRGYKVVLSDRKVKIGGVITLFKNIINARDIKKHMEKSVFISQRLANHFILVYDPNDTPTLYSCPWHIYAKHDLAFYTDNIHQDIRIKVRGQLGGNGHRPVILSIIGTTIYNRA